MRLKPTTIAVRAPKAGASKDQCFLCTSPSYCAPEFVQEFGNEAFLGGMIEGILALTQVRAHLPGGRVPLCAEHETAFREHLAVCTQDALVFARLGIEFDTVKDQGDIS